MTCAMKGSNRWLSGMVGLLTAAVPVSVLAYQPDALFIQYQERNKAAWATQDKTIDQKLAALEKKFGKKPNIIYILTDDIGWGELGWQGGGKHRGTPTPELDKLAFEGMRFWSAYSEPSCTPSRGAALTGQWHWRLEAGALFFKGFELP